MTAALPAPLAVFLAQAAPPAAPAAPATTTATSGTPAVAPGTEAPVSPGLFGSPIVPILLMGVIFYFMIIRPQQRRAKEQAALVAAVKSGDEVLTSSGIYGTVTNVNPEKKTVTVRIADNVKVIMSREAVTTVLNKTETTVVSSSPVAAKPVR